MTAAPVARRRPGRRPRYSREQVLDAIREWTRLHGSPPAVADWEPSRARRLGEHWRAERFSAGEWPSARMVGLYFPRFGDAIAAAGLDPPLRRGTRARTNGPEEIVRAIREWTRRYGEPPTQADWDPYRARQLRQMWRIARYREGEWPSLAAVRRHHGSLSAAVAAAGVADRGGDERIFRAGGARERPLRPADGNGNGALGPHALAESLTRIAAARRTRDPDALERGLIDLAAAALRWADQVGAERSTMMRGVRRV
jgi:hypothetical protein